MVIGCSYCGFGLSVAAAAFCMTDQWFGLTMDDIRKMEAQSASELKVIKDAHAHEHGHGHGGHGHEHGHGHGHAELTTAAAGGAPAAK